MMKRVLILLAATSITAGAAFADTPGTPVGAGAAVATPASAPEITTPTEVGSTTMPAGNYLVTEQSSGKSYALMVSSKGTMILSPAPHGATAGGAAGATAGAAPGAAGSAMAGAAGAAMKGLMNKGAMQLLESGATKQIKNFIPK